MILHALTAMLWSDWPPHASLAKPHASLAKPHAFVTIRETEELWC